MIYRSSVLCRLKIDYYPVAAVRPSLGHLGGQNCDGRPNDAYDTLAVLAGQEVKGGSGVI